MTRVHDDKYERFGGILAAFDPVTNLRVGVQVLKECITRAGSVEAGLRYYVGSGNQVDDNGYASKVLAEQGYLKNVAKGKQIATNAPLVPAAAPAIVVPVVAPPVSKPAVEPATAEEQAEPARIALLR